MYTNTVSLTVENFCSVWGHMDISGSEAGHRNLKKKKQIEVANKVEPVEPVSHGTLSSWRHMPACQRKAKNGFWD